jgi:glycyl-tRNA synthetase beta chain
MGEGKDLLVEIGTEELPPRSLRALAESFAEGVCVGLEGLGLGFAGHRWHATPRRLAVVVEGLAERQPDRAVERKGPALTAAFDEDGNPTPAGLGFARSCGVTVDDLEKLETDKGAWLAYRTTRIGATTPALLPGVVAQALDRLPIPKRMRWGEGEAEFVRPVHWVVLLFDTEAVPATVLGVQAGRESHGHRFHHPGPLVLERPADYPGRLEQPGRVLVDCQRRREIITEQVQRLAAALGGKPMLDEALLDEVSALVEWPRALAGSFDERYLQVPHEVLITTMEDQQRYFPVVDQDNRLLPHFIAVANLESRDPDQVRTGNERVIRPRFADAEFFWQQDRKRPLVSRRAYLKDVIFQDRLGSLLDKTERVAELAGAIASALGADGALARRAAELSKCDLMTDLVGEFPSLQGIMGRHYAQHDGEPMVVSQALDEQYMPRQAGGALPQSPVGQALSLADRLDTLIGIFAIGQRPTGDKDPFGLRRAALGVLRILIEGGLDLDLEQLLTLATRGFPKRLAAERVVGEVFDYVMERLRAYYMDRAVPVDVIDAVVARRPTRPLDLHKRVLAVQDFLRMPQAEALAGANKRIANILRQASGALPERVDESRLQEPAEQALYRTMAALGQEVEGSFDAGEYHQALARLAGLREPIDLFFDQVMVMSDDEGLRRNRLALLNRLGRLFLRAADLSRLQERPR